MKTFYLLLILLTSISACGDEKKIKENNSIECKSRDTDPSVPERVDMQPPIEMPQIVEKKHPIQHYEFEMIDLNIELD